MSCAHCWVPPAEVSPGVHSTPYLSIAHAPGAAVAGGFPANGARAVDFGDLLGGHAATEDVAVGQSGGAEDAGVGDAQELLARGVDLADLVVVHGGDEEAAVGQSFGAAPAAVGAEIDAA